MTESKSNYFSTKKEKNFYPPKLETKKWKPEAERIILALDAGEEIVRYNTQLTNPVNDKPEMGKQRSKLINNLRELTDKKIYSTSRYEKQNEGDSNNFWILLFSYQKLEVRKGKEKK